MVINKYNFECYYNQKKLIDICSASLVQSGKKKVNIINYCTEKYYYNYNFFLFACFIFCFPSFSFCNLYF